MKKLLVALLSLLFLTSCSAKANAPTNDSKGKDKKSSNGEIVNPVINPGDGDILVAYFSVTNHTKTLATYAQEHLEADIFEIVPEEPYTEEDIAYSNDNCRANKEQNDSSARPKIKYTISDISKYKTIVLGYPIWWAQAPKIMYTFIESYDFANKTILPFCTSGSSPIGTSATNLAKSAPNANWLEGRRFDAGTSQETINDWLDEYFKKETNMKLKIDEQELDVTWEDNESVKALKAILPVTINMHEYGGFEQTGAIGQSIVRNDTNINTKPGDIVLYAGNQISVFYGNNSYSYTRLGHINLSDAELKTLLNKSAVVFSLLAE